MRITVEIGGINEPMLQGMLRCIEHSKRARWTNASVRADAIEYPYEAGWIKHMRVFRNGQELKGLPFDDPAWFAWRKAVADEQQESSQ